MARTVTPRAAKLIARYFPMPLLQPVMRAKLVCPTIVANDDEQQENPGRRKEGRKEGKKEKGRERRGLLLLLAFAFLNSGEDLQS